MDTSLITKHHCDLQLLMNLPLLIYWTFVLGEFCSVIVGIIKEGLCIFFKPATENVFQNSVYLRESAQSILVS